jgi:tRNA(His) 5'-end guanylyltransferase
MGRKRQSNYDDPPRFHKKGCTWYHVGTTLPRKWTKLSADRAEALRMWAQIEGRKEDDSTKLFRSL